MSSFRFIFIFGYFRPFEWMGCVVLVLDFSNFDEKLYDIWKCASTVWQNATMSSFRSILYFGFFRPFESMGCVNMVLDFSKFDERIV